jgi:tRNA pseudouridine38-40 synthase
MPRYLAYFEYDGTGFRGFQYQPGERTVQGEIERCLERITGVRIPVAGAGRTDAGVHALAMPAHLDIERGGDRLSALARILPRDISLVRWFPVRDAFNARFDAVERTYHYRIGKRRSPLKARTEYQPWLTLDTEAMDSAAGLSLGRADWRAFAKSGGGNSTWIMDVRDAGVTEDAEGWTIRITSDRFLRGVVRLWAGTLLRVGTGRLSPDVVSEILGGVGTVASGPSLPACGLTLVEVKYDCV